MGSSPNAAFGDKRKKTKKMVKATETRPPAKKKMTPPLQSSSPRSSNVKRTQNSEPLNSKSPNSHFTDFGVRRSTRPKPILDGVWSALEDNEDDERKLKKQKLVQPLKSQPVSVRNSLSSEAMLDRIGDGVGSEAKDRCGNVIRVKDASSRVLEGGSGPTTPLPDKKTILFILHRLQKKDTHGVFSEPVDHEELPDYHEIIDNPMDFSTMRKKLDNGLYQTLEQFEEDVLLICSNAMQYNSPSTIYFRKAKTIQELAKRDFDNLRQKGEDGEPQPRVIRRGRPPKAIEKSPEQAVMPVPSYESPSAAFGSVSENSKNYNLRKCTSSNKFITDETLPTGTDEPSSVSLQEWNTEFPASILRAPYGKKSVVVDETRRETYKQPVANVELPAKNMQKIEPQILLPVGVGMTEQHVYPSSLARFAAGLGPVAMEIASRKIKQCLAPGMEFDLSQFAYETPKFPVYEVDANLRPVIPATRMSNYAPMQTSPSIDANGVSLETAETPRQESMNQVNSMTVGIAVDPISDRSSLVEPESP